MIREQLSRDFLFRKAEVVKDLLDSRGIPNDHEKEYDFINKHRDGLSRLTRMAIKQGDLIGTFPDIVEASLGIENDMQDNAHLKSFNYKIVNRRESGANLPKEVVVYAKRR